MYEEIIEVAKEAFFTGTQIAYFLICHRKLWLFSHHIEMEWESEAVAVGSEIHTQFFKRKSMKEVLIDNVKVDFIETKDGEIVINEIKKSRSMEEAHCWQVKYYIFCLQNKGINCKKGIIHYPLLHRKKEILFSDEDKHIIDKFLKEGRKIINLSQPPPYKEQKICRNCAYFFFCSAEIL